MKLIFKILILQLLTTVVAFGQSEFKCGTDEVLKGNLELQKILENIEKDYQQKKQNQLNVTPDMTTVYTIPVVFHVYHLGEAVGSGSNVSDAAIQATVNRLNAVFRATGIYSGLTPDIKIQFVLASRTPNCQTTNGIVRIDGRGIAGYTNGVPFSDYTMQQELRNLSTWSPAHYINIRICHTITGTGGFAFYLNDLFMPAGSVSTTPVFADGFWAHEMGHSLNLYHTFYGDGTPNGGGTGTISVCPVNNDPENDGDKVSDTDPHKNDDGCNHTAINSCTGNPFGDILKNIMSYSCPEKFTPKQMERMRYALVNYRSGLINSLGKISPSGIGSPPILACIPTFSNGLSLYYGISAFNVGDITYNGSASSYDGVNYQDLTCLSFTQFQINNSYSFNLTGTWGNAMWGKIFIDYNNDGDFDDNNEQVYNSNGAYPTLSGAILPSTDALTNVLLRMRVVLDGGYNPSACNLPGGSGYGSGSAIDFAVKILPVNCTPPSAPITTSASRCGVGTVILTSSGCNGTYNWYEASSGGTSLASTSSFTTPTLNSTTNYYVSCTIGSCTSIRTLATATVKIIPSAPTLTANPASITSGQSSTLTASNCSGTVSWSNSLGTGSSKIVSPISSTTYTATCTVNGCTSGSASTTVTINSCSLVAPTTTSASRCGGGTLILTSSGCNGTYNWYEASSGGTSLASTSSFTTPTLNSTTNYYVSCTVGSCTSTRTLATATVKTIPSAPTLTASPASITSGQSSTLTASNCSGTVSWSNGLGTGSSKIVLPTSSTTYTATCTVNGCTSGSATVTVNVNPCPNTILHTGNVAAGTYKAAQTITASGNTVSNTYYQAGKAILLNPGFSAGFNEVFEAKIQGCVFIPINGLVAYYPFNGNSNDASGNGNNGVVTGATLGNDRFGIADKAYRFNDGNYITVANSTSLSLANSFTFSMWVNMQSTIGRDGYGGVNTYGYHSLFTKNCDRGQLQAAIAPASNGSFQFNTYASSVGNNPVISFALNQWKHLIVVYDGTYLKHFVDGNMISSVAVTMNLTPSNSYDLVIGKMGCWSYYFNGFIDEFRMYNRGLSDTEVLQIYHAEKP